MAARAAASPHLSLSAMLEAGPVLTPNRIGTCKKTTVMSYLPVLIDICN